ncbi:TIM21-domain-containing protein [Cytidiella melzeri]|nr:TIM21-domain-containing protein [Cytidiella melzeri]
MNLHSTRALPARRTIITAHRHTSLASSVARSFNLTYQCRAYATHRDPPINPSLVSHTLDQRRAGTRQRDTVGPFQLGLIPPTPKDGGNQKKWSELSTGGKVVRSTARMTNLFVILFGAGFTAVLVYALTSELFSKNSATVLYGQACELIKSSPKVAQYFKGPLVFHNNPPSAVRPRHRNDRVASQSGRDAHGRETMLLTFFVEAKRRSGSNYENENQSWWESASEWASRSTATVSDMSAEEAWQHTKDYASEKWDSTRRLFRFLSGDVVPASKAPPPAAVPEMKETKQESGWTSSFVGLFSGIRVASSGSGSSAVDVDGVEGLTEGEVQAMLVMNDNHQFEFRYLRIDIPGEYQ